MNELYRQHRNLFENKEWEWIVEDNALLERSPAGHERRLPWADVVHIQIAFAPTRYKAWRHASKIVWSNGAVVQIDNACFKSFGEFENRSTEYTRFIKAAIRQIAQYSPYINVHLGSSWVGYIFGLLVAGIPLTFLVIVFFMLPLPMVAWPATALVKVGLIALMAPSFLTWIVRSRPDKASIHDIKDKDLPKQ